MKKAAFSESKSCNHSRKDCVCGGHNSKNVKSNTNHNSTRAKLLVKKTRKTTPKMLVSEDVLRKEWDTAAEDKAWIDL